MLQRSHPIGPRRPRALTVDLTLESHNAVGPSRRRLSGSNCVVNTFALTALARVAAWPELANPGVFVLIGSANGHAALRTAVGKAPNIIQYLSYHESNLVDERYLQIATVTSNDGYLNDGISDYVCQRLSRTLRSSGLVELVGDWQGHPNLQMKDIDRAERFFRDALLLLGPVEPMMGLLAATVACAERKPSSNRHDDNHDVV